MQKKFTMIDENFECEVCGNDVKKFETTAREIRHEQGNLIRPESLQKIAKMEREAHLEEMVEFSHLTGSGEVRSDISTPREFADNLEDYLENINIIIGEDWYFIYSDDNKEIDIYDLARVEPINKEDKTKQFLEIREGFFRILKQAKYFEKENIKPKKSTQI